MLVVPALWLETFCLTIREAMLAGVPVLASDLGAMHEALSDLELDLLVNADELPAIAIAICQSLSERLREMNRKAAETNPAEVAND